MTPPKPPIHRPQPERSGPPRRALWALTLAVGLAHLALLLGLTHTLEWQPQLATASFKTRLIEPPAVTVHAGARPTAATRKAPPRRTSPTALQPVAPSDTPKTPETPDTPDAPEPSTAVAVEPASAASEPNTQASAEGPSATPTPPQASTPPVANDTTVASWPNMALGAVPPSTLLSYQLTGMDKGFTYSASGELRWQHNPQAYDLSLSVKAFLLGSRQWRSTGQIGAAGLSPLKFTDNWRGERASHFDREQGRIVFSGNAPVAALQAGAQDQISLYLQLAGAMAGEPERYAVGTRLQVQTATLRDAVPWLLMLDGQEPLTVAGQTVTTTKWLCQPRSQFDSRVEMWLSPQHAWMPVRIRISQANGSYIDLNLRSSEPLPPLATVASVPEK